MPARHKARHRVFEAFGEGKLLFWNVFIAWIVSRITWVRLIQPRRADIVTPAPDLHLLFPVLRCRFSFVEALQRPIMSFVKPPVALNRNPHEVHLIQYDPQCAYRPFQQRGEGDVEGISLVLKRETRLLGLLSALVR